MSSKIGDAWLWVGLGVTLFVGANGISRIIRDLVDIAEDDEADAQEEGQDGYTMVEKVNDISPESLRVLATCQNANIRRAATRLLLDRLLVDRQSCSRVVHDLRDAPAGEAVHRAENAVKLFALCHYVVSQSLFDSLTSEQKALAAELLPPRAIAHFDLPIRNDATSFFREVQRILHGTASQVEADDFFTFFRANRELIDLTPAERGIIEALEARYYSTSQTDVPPPGVLPPARLRPRVSEETPEELARRRRRREAMVLNEGDRPLSQRDIIQRRRTEEGNLMAAAAVMGVDRQGLADALDHDRAATAPAWMGFLYEWLTGWA